MNSHFVNLCWEAVSVKQLHSVAFCAAQPVNRLAKVSRKAFVASRATLRKVNVSGESSFRRKLYNHALPCSEGSDQVTTSPLKV